MIDITPFLYKGNIKPELSMVYVKEKQGNKYAVATDTFRLVEIKLDDFCCEHIKQGFYKADKWKIMCKSYNSKKQNLQLFAQTIQENNLSSEERKNWNYPDYEVILNDSNLENFNPTSQFTKDFLIDFIKFYPDNKYIDFSKIRDNGKMISYFDDNLKIVLMKLSK